MNRDMGGIGATEHLGLDLCLASTAFSRDLIGTVGSGGLDRRVYELYSMKALGRSFFFSICGWAKRWISWMSFFMPGGTRRALYDFTIVIGTLG